jgi:hypothetical protein
LQHFYSQDWALDVARIGFIVVDQGANMIAAVSAYTDEESDENELDYDEDDSPFTARLLCVVHVVVRALKVSVEDNVNPNTLPVRYALKIARKVKLSCSLSRLAN